MSRETGIEWTDATWNPIRGCSRVSEGCRNCYAETVANRFCGPGSPYEGVVQIGADGKGNGKWNGQIKFVEKRLLDPLRWKKPQRIFVNSTSDLFHENVTAEMLDRIFAVMALCPQHTFQVLTKRPARMMAYFNGLDVDGHDMAGSIGAMRWSTEAGGFFPRDASLDRKIRDFIGDAHEDLGGHVDEDDYTDYQLKPIQWPLPNVQLGVSVENQKAADERIPLLLQTPAAVRFLSCEPLLGAIDLHNLDAHALSRAGGHVPSADELEEPWKYDCLTSGDIYWGGPGGISDGPEHNGIDWVIVGGESGPGARPMHPDWARSLRDQCVAAGVPFFFKQWGEWYPFKTMEIEALQSQFPGLSLKTPTALIRRDGRMVQPYCMLEGPGNEMVRVGKKAAGALLDGREWREMPR